MATEILLPRLGWTMEEGIFGEWLVKDGATVREGDLLFTMEGDKATQEIEALESGILRIFPDGPRPGDLIPVGALLGYLVAEGEQAPFEDGESQTIASAGEAAPAIEPAAEPQSTSSDNRPSTSDYGSPTSSNPAISPRARRVATELGVNWQTLRGSGRTGRIVERDVRAAAQQANGLAGVTSVGEAAPRETTVRATPVAQRVAQEAGIDLAHVAPTGAGGRIQREDVEKELARRSVSESRSAESGDTATRISHSRTRRIIAQRMVESRQTTAPVTLNTEVDATALVTLRAQLKHAYARRNLPAPTYNDLLIKLVGVALRDHPALNATWEEDALVLWEEVHIGLAVDADAGLLVPVVREVQNKSVAQIAATTRDLISRAQAGKATPADLQGGTFTISNLGMYDIDAFTPMINLPECAILGVGRIVEKPVAREGAIVVRSMIALSLTFDHRAIDGAPAARFLQQAGQFIEEPALWMME